MILIFLKSHSFKFVYSQYIYSLQMRDMISGTIKCLDFKEGMEGVRHGDIHLIIAFRSRSRWISVDLSQKQITNPPPTHTHGTWAA